MPVITITLEVPDGTAVHVEASDPSATKNDDEGGSGLSPEVAAAIERLVPSRFQPYTDDYIRRVVEDLGCTVEIPSGARQEYVNIFPPARCRRARVSSITFSSTRTAIFAGPIELDGYELAEKTYNSGTYSYPKLPHLASTPAVDEAIALTTLAITRFER